MTRAYLLICTILVLALSDSNGKELDRGLSNDITGTYKECVVSLSKLAKESDEPFIISVYSLFNKNLPSKNIKYIEDYVDNGVDKYRVSSKLKKEDIHSSCLENINYTVQKRFDNNSSETEINQAKPISVLKHGNHYYLLMFDWQYLDFDDIGDVVSLNTVIFDIKGRTRNFVRNASVWISVEGSNTIVDAYIEHNKIKMIKIGYSPELNNNGDILVDNTGHIANYVKSYEAYIVGEYEIDSKGMLIEKLGFDFQSLLK
jgi:hypothetical protein